MEADAPRAASAQHRRHLEPTDRIAPITSAPLLPDPRSPCGCDAAQPRVHALAPLLGLQACGSANRVCWRTPGAPGSGPTSRCPAFCHPLEAPSAPMRDPTAAFWCYTHPGPAVPAPLSGRSAEPLVNMPAASRPGRAQGIPILWRRIRDRLRRDPPSGRLLAPDASRSLGSYRRVSRHRSEGRGRERLARSATANCWRPTVTRSRPTT